MSEFRSIIGIIDGTLPESSRAVFSYVTQYFFAILYIYCFVYFSFLKRRCVSFKLYAVALEI